MRIEKRDGTADRLILAHMVTNPVICGRIASQWTSDGLFSGQWANLVGRWCVAFNRKFGGCPGAAIRGQFERWASRGTVDAEIVSAIEKFLAFLSDEHEAAEAHPIDYILDVAGRVFHLAKIRKHITDLEADIEAGDVDSAIASATSFSRIELAGSDGVNPLNDDSLVDAAYAEPPESIIEYPGAMGEFIGPTFCREGFVVFLAPEKRGKSQWLLDAALRGAMQRRRVAFFAIGDMTQKDVNLRWFTRISRLPRFPGIIKIPTSIRKIGKGDTDIQYKEKEFNTLAQPGTVKPALAAFREDKIKSQESYLKLFSHPAGTLTVDGIRSQLAGLENKGWTPDIIVIDYADLIAPPSGKSDERGEINAIWIQLRAMSQTSHALVLTATQAKAEGYSCQWLGMQHFSGDKRKNAHVTGMIGINQTAEEEKQQIYRLNWIARREFPKTRPVYVGSCLPLANACVVSCFREKE